MFDPEEIQSLKATYPNVKVPMHPGLAQKRQASKPGSTSHSRFHQRITIFRGQGKPVALHHFWWFVHNAVCHPLIAVLPIKPLFDFHDFTSRKINAR